MPDLGLPENTPIAKDLKRIPVTDREDAYDLWKNPPYDVIGEGAESVVVQMEGKPHKVVAYSYVNMSPLEAKRQFYLHRIFERLFPHNFPHFYATQGSDDPNKLTGSIRARVENGKSPINYPFNTVEIFLRRYGIPSLMDESEVNFVVGSDGGEYYIDRLVDDKLPEDFHERVARLMDDRPTEYSETDRTTVKNSIDRLQQLSLV